MDLNANVPLKPFLIVSLYLSLTGQILISNYEVLTFNSDFQRNLVFVKQPSQALS